MTVPPDRKAGDPDCGEGRVDLHTHSTASDGTRSPREVVRAAHGLGLTGLSLTDHDTVRGQEEAADEAKRLGLDYLVGAELSANDPGRSVHLLAFGFDFTHRPLIRFLERYDEDRRRRARSIVDRLRGLGIPLRYADVEANAGRAAPTRAHVARALVHRGLVADEQEVFDRYLGWGKPAYVEKSVTPPADVMRRVHEAGGVVVLAHPGRAGTGRAVRQLVSEGLDGVEVLHPSNSPQIRRRMRRLSKELRLLVSGGSDWHGPGTRRNVLGLEDVPYRWLRELRQAAAASGRT